MQILLFIKVDSKKYFVGEKINVCFVSHVKFIIYKPVFHKSKIIEHNNTLDLTHTFDF